MPRTTYALVDFSNVAVELHQKRFVHRLDLERIVDRIANLIFDVGKNIQPSPDEIFCRLYHGWHLAHPDKPTDHHQALSRVLRNNYPTRIGRIRVSVSIADTLLVLPNDPIRFTVREIPGQFNFRISRPSNCAKTKHDCYLAQLEEWKRGRCPEPSCPVKTNDVLFRLLQKTVDTSICCDAVALSTQHDNASIIVFSDDDDVLPALLTASKFGARITQLRTIHRQHSRYYDHLLLREGIELLDI